MLKWTLLILVVCPAATRAAALRPAGVTGFFVMPGEAATLRWQVASGKLEAPVEYTIRDYWDKPVTTGRAKIGEKGAVEATVKLAQGFYDVEIPATKQRFGVVSLAASAGKADPFFCIDSAMSWLVRDDDVRAGLVAVLARSGIAMSRERLSWSQINPAKGKWSWQADRRYETVRKLHAARGVAVLEMFHDAPSWPGKVGKYPQDLVAATRSWEQIARRYRPTWGALEVWNEPDIFFGANLPADQYVPLVRAIAYALARGGADVPLVGGVVAHHNRRFLDTAARNGLLDCIDTFSFHTYGHAPQMEGLIGRYRSWLADHKREAMPLWLTECGRPWKRGPDRPPADQDAASALDIVMKAVEARAGGVARYFAFVYPYYEERGNNFGMMGRRATPLRSFAAYARLAAVLGGKKYLGDLKCPDASIQRARVFGDARETVAVIYTGRVGAGRAVKLGVPPLRVEGIDGRPLPAAKGAPVPVPDGLSYAWLDRAKLAKPLRTDTPMMRLWRIALRKPPRRGPPSPVVLRFEADRRVLKAESNGYRFADPQSAAGLRMRVRAFNLDTKAREVTLTLSPPVGGKILEGPAAQSVKLPPEASADAAWRVDLSGAFARAQRTTVKVAAAEGLRAAGVLAVELEGGASLKQVLKWHQGQLALPIGDLSRWTKNVVGHGKMTMEWTAEKHWRLGVTFGKGDPWVYPYFRLPAGLDLSRAKGLVVRARCQEPATVRVFLWEGDRGVGYLAPGGIIPADGKWHTAVVNFADLTLSAANAPDPDGRLDLKAVRRISIGLNSKAPRNTLDVSDVYVVGR